MGRTFDAILFFECFHHCSDHRELIRKLAVALVPEGRVYFAAEPIDDSFAMPWGLRLMGSPFGQSGVTAGSKPDSRSPTSSACSIISGGR